MDGVSFLTETSGKVLSNGYEMFMNHLARIEVNTGNLSLLRKAAEHGALYIATTETGQQIYSYASTLFPPGVQESQSIRQEYVVGAHTIQNISNLYQDNK